MKFLCLLCCMLLAVLSVGTAAAEESSLYVKKIENLPEDFILGMDASCVIALEDSGVKYYNFDGQEEDVFKILADNGVNYIRVRIWNDPYDKDGNGYGGGNCDIDNYVKLGKLAKSYGYKLLLDFHYSDFWADPGKQTVPKAWRGLGVDGLCDAMYSFTRSCLVTAVESGVEPDYIQVGNEITCGMLWPYGRLEKDGKRGNYDNFCRLVKAGARACREICPNAKIILHLERSNAAEVYQEFFTKMDEFCVDYDIIGASYYPYWHGTPNELFANLRACRRFGKQIMVTELGYGFTDKPYQLGGEDCRLVIDAERAYIKGFSDKYPLSPDGQTRFVRDFLAAARENRIDGVFYWEPLWLPGEGICWASETGQEYIGEAGKSTANEWANQCLFDYEGKKLPAFDEYRK